MRERMGRWKPQPSIAFFLACSATWILGLITIRLVGPYLPIRVLGMIAVMLMIAGLIVGFVVQYLVGESFRVTAGP